MAQNKTSYTNGTVQLGGTLTFNEMKGLEAIFKNAALDAATSSDVRDLEIVTGLAEILGVDSATLEDAEVGHLEEVGA